MANIPITDNTTLLNTLKAKAQALPANGSGSTDAPDLSGITAAAEDILAGKKSVDATGAEITGTMTNRGAWSSTKTSNGSVTIPEGYHNGSGEVTVNVSSTTTIPTDGDAATSDVLTGKTFYSGGSKKTGTMTNQGAWSTTKTSNGDVQIPAGFHNGSGKVTVNVSTSTSAGALDTPSINFDTTNGKFTATSKVKTSGYISTSETKSASYILTRYLGGEYTPTKESKTVSLTEKYCTGDVVIKGDNNLIPANIKNGISIFGVAGSYTGDGANVLSITSDRTWNSTLDSSFDYHRIAYFSIKIVAKYVMCMATATSGTYDSSNVSNPDSVEAIFFNVTNKTCYIRTSSSLSTVETEIGGGTHPLVIFKNDDSYGFSVFVKGTYLCYDTYRTFIVG